MSTDPYPEVSVDESGIVPPQGARPSEWPKKLRTLTAAELDRLTIDNSGRFYWDGKLVNYDTGTKQLTDKTSESLEHSMDLLDRASRDLGFGPVAAVNPDRAGAADVSFIAAEAKMILDGVGLMGHDDHTPGETADLSTLPSQTKRAAITLYRLTAR
jgi:hypothetical protein